MNEMLRFGALTFDPHARELRRDGVAISLSPKAFRLLELLIEARPRAITREALYRELWPDVVVEPGNLHGLVSEIRAAAGDREVIRTVHRVGYAFTTDAVAVESVRFSILYGDEEIPLRAGENIIGRDPRDTIAIHAPEISRRHARLTVAAGGVTLEDLGSKNGTFVGTRRVEGVVELQPGDEILVGVVRLRLIRTDPLASTATA